MNHFVLYYCYINILKIKMNFNFNGSTDDSSMLAKTVGKGLQNKIDKESGISSCCPSLTIKQRVIGFGVCTGLGKAI